MVVMREQKIETATRRKVPVIDLIVNATSGAPGPWALPLEEPENLGVYVKNRAYKDNPESRDRGDIGFTWKGPLVNMEEDYETSIFNIEADFKPTQMLEHSMRAVQHKIPMKKGEPDRPQMMHVRRHFGRNRIVILSWGTDDGVIITIKQILIIPLFMLEDWEIILRDNKDKHQIAYNAERLMGLGDHPGWQDVDPDLKARRFNVNRQPVPLEVYVPERLLWISKHMD